MYGIFQQTHITGLQAAYKFYKIPTCLSTEVPSSRSQKYKGVQEPIHQIWKYNAKYSDV
jgi:hypothetical protein